MTECGIDPVVGRILDGRYVVEALVGRGGMGTVYKARHIELSAPRAIKVMRAEFANDQVYLERFRNEARVAEQLRHPNVVALHDFSILPNGTPYIVWEYVAGETLAVFYRRGVRLQPQEVVAIVSQVADGLAAAHRKGVVHRDVSPDNIMISRAESGHPTAKVLDFGIAKVLGGPRLTQTASSTFFGKIGYASPEQMGLLREDQQLDARTDIFSLAAVTYEMLTGHLPFRASSVQSYVQEVLLGSEEDIKARIATGILEVWRDALLPALARDREQRTQRMEIFREDVERAGRGSGPRSVRVDETPETLPLPLTPASVTPRQRALFSKRGYVAGAVMSGALLVAAAIGWWPGDEDTPREPAETRAQTTPTSGSVSTVLLPAATTSLLQDATSPLEKARTRNTHGINYAGPGARSGQRPLTTTTTLAETAGFPQPREPESVGSSTPLEPHASATAPEDATKVIADTPSKVVQVGYGNLAITSETWVEVSLDGGDPVQTPVLLSRIPAGRHSIRASRAGFHEKVVEVDVDADKTITVPIKLEKKNK